MTSYTRILIAISLLTGASLAAAQPIVYPAQGQNQEQQNKDQGECHTWAVQNTGMDPAALAAQTLQQLADNQQGQLDTYYRAYGACLTGRGYTVN